MQTRPAGTEALAEAFPRFPFPPERMRAFTAPVLFVFGGRSRYDHYGRMAQRPRGLFPDFTIEVFEERHHFDPPHRAEPERYARLLEDHWRSAEASVR